jgi:hypothetical protein
LGGGGGGQQQKGGEETDHEIEHSEAAAVR